MTIRKLALPVLLIGIASLVGCGSGAPADATTPTVKTKDAPANPTKGTGAQAAPSLNPNYKGDPAGDDARVGSALKNK